LKDEYTFAANKIFVAFEDTDWCPAYFICRTENGSMGLTSQGEIIIMNLLNT
jgi:hypothetical protein